MAHFVKLDENNIVLEVHCVHNNELLDENGNELEQRGIDFLVNWSGGYPYWKQTSYNANYRKHFAGIGFKYDSNLDAFIPPKPYQKWVLNKSTLNWESPIPYPQDEKFYRWDDETSLWIEIEARL